MKYAVCLIWMGLMLSVLEFGVVRQLFVYFILHIV